MAEQSKNHLWLNTFIASLALAVSGVAAFVQWNNFTRKNEVITFFSAPRSDCVLQMQKTENGGELALCWNLIITNQSDSKTSLIWYRVLESREDGNHPKSQIAFNAIEARDGSKFIMPIVLDSGESKTFLARVPISVPNSIAKIVENLGTTGQKVTLYDLARSESNSGMDILGRKIELTKDQSGKIIMAHWTDSFQMAYGYFQFGTGRGNEFDAMLSYPPIPE